MWGSRKNPVWFGMNHSPLERVVEKVLLDKEDFFNNPARAGSGMRHILPDAMAAPSASAASLT